MSNRVRRLVYFLTTILLGLTILFLCHKIEMYADYNSELHGQLAQSANAYDDAIKRAWQSEGELDYYKPSFERLEEAYNYLLENPIEIEVPVEVEVSKKVPIEVVKYRNIFPREFESVEQFEEWYWEQVSAIKLGFTCVDYAKWLQRTALTQGYPVSQALVWWGRYYNKKVSADNRAHAGNLVLIANTYYYVEPHPEWFKVLQLVERD